MGLLVVAAPFLVNVAIAREINMQVTANPKEAAPAYVAIVLGARVYPNGGVSPVLMDRLDTGVELYKEGKVYIARQLGLKVSGVMADRRPYVGMRYMAGKEFLARNKAFM
ncbi:MAG: hypothetical protein M0Z31_01740 [Clostridia bacterium]|nr:hypothetical protein [Clostridia bacterium]